MDRQKMNDFETRWETDPLFRFLKTFLLNPSAQPDGMTRREWYARAAPKTEHPVREATLDCRGLNLDHQEVGEIWLNYILDEGSFRACKFKKTFLQSASAERCHFDRSVFDYVQMSPFYGANSDFGNCQFISCFAQGAGPRNHTNSEGVPTKGTYSDFRDCNFTNAIAVKTGFDRCDFRNADFTGASFEGCIFSESDLRGVKFGKAQFVRCDLRMAMVDDTPEWRNALGLNGNLDVDTVVWCK
jgi:uncharacterized protein YjbI with pentapeptide repeats